MYSKPVSCDPSLYSASKDSVLCTALQLLETALPPSLTFHGDRFFIMQGKIMTLNFEGDSLRSTLSEIPKSIVSTCGPNELLSGLVFSAELKKVGVLYEKV